MGERRVRTTYLSLLKIKSYFCIWFGQSVSNFGDLIFQSGYVWLAYTLTQSATMAGIVVFASTAPYLLFGLVGGVYADRWNRKTVMILGDTLRAIAVLVLTLAMSFHHLSLWLLMSIAFFMNSVRCFFYPSLRATLTNLLKPEQRQAGNAFLQLSFQLSKVLGYSLGGLMIAYVPMWELFLVTFLTYTVSYLTIIPVKSEFRKPNATNKVTVYRDLMDTFQFLWGVRQLFWSVMMYGFGLLFVTCSTRLAIPRISDHVWHTGSEGFGYIVAALGLGNMIGSFIVGRLNIKSLIRHIFVGWTLWAGLLALVGLIPWLWAALPIVFFSGAFEAVADVPMVLLIQSHAPEEKLGKVFSAWSTTSFIGESGSSYIVAALIAGFGASQSILIGNAVVVAVALIGLVCSYRIKPPSVSQATPMRETVSN